jgi:hypothetical protein
MAARCFSLNAFIVSVAQSFTLINSYRASLYHLILHILQRQQACHPHASSSCISLLLSQLLRCSALLLLLPSRHRVPMRTSLLAVPSLASRLSTAAMSKVALARSPRTPCLQVCTVLRSVARLGTTLQTAVAVSKSPMPANRSLPW